MSFINWKTAVITRKSKIFRKQANGDKNERISFLIWHSPERKSSNGSVWENFNRFS
jgi:hypothetical protein